MAASHMEKVSQQWINQKIIYVDIIIFWNSTRCVQFELGPL